MNEKYIKLYEFFKTNSLTDLDQQQFFDTYSQDNSKYADMYEFMIQNQLTDLNINDFYNEYFKAPEPEKKKEVPGYQSRLEEIGFGDGIPELPTVEAEQLSSSVASPLPSTNDTLTYRDKQVLQSLNAGDLDTFNQYSKEDWAQAQLDIAKNGRDKDVFGNKAPEKEIPFLAELTKNATGIDTGVLKFLTSLPLGDFVDDVARELFAGVIPDSKTIETNIDYMQQLLTNREFTMDDVRALADAEQYYSEYEKMYGKSEETIAYENYIAENGDTFYNNIIAYILNPSVMSQQAARSMGSLLNIKSLNAAAATIGTGMGVGALGGAGLLGTPTAGVLALPGAGAGAMIGAASAALPAFSIASSISEMGLSFSDMVGMELDRLGLERNEENILRVLNSDESRANILKRSATRGGTIAMIDFLGGKASGRLATKMLGKGYKPLSAAGAGVFTEATAGAAGEVSARLAVGQDITPSEVTAEFFGEVGGFAVSGGKPVFNAYKERAELARRGLIEINGKLPEYTINGQKVTPEQFITIITAADPQELKDMRIQVDNDPSMERFVNNKFTDAEIRSTLDPSISKEDADALVDLEMQRAELQSRMSANLLDVTVAPKHNELTENRLKMVESQIDAILAKYTETEQDVDTQQEPTEQQVDEAIQAVERQREIDERRAAEIAQRKAELEAEGKVDEAEQIEEPQERVILDVKPRAERGPARAEGAKPLTNAVSENVGQTYEMSYTDRDGKKQTVQGELIVEGDGDGRRVSLQSFDGKQVIELGNYDELSGNSTLSLGLKPTQPNVVANNDGSFVVNNKNYTNPNENPEQAITRDKDGNIVNVRLQDEKGRMRTFRGTNADALAYEITLASFEDKAQLEQQLEQLENEDTDTKQAFEQARAAEQTAAQETTPDTQQAEQATPQQPVTKAGMEEYERRVKERQRQQAQQKKEEKQPEPPKQKKKEKPTQEAPKNKKVDTENMPLVTDKKTGKKYRRVAGSPQEGVSLYVPDGTDVYVDESGLYRPSETEANQTIGEYVGDSMFDEAAPAQPAAKKAAPKKKAPDKKASDQEIAKLQADKEYYENKIEEAQEEIEIEKGNYKEEVAKIKEEIAKIRKDKNMSKEEKTEAIDELKEGKLVDLKNDHDDTVDSYKDDIKEAKRELAAVNRKLNKAQGPEVKMQSGKGDGTTQQKPEEKKDRVKATGVKDLIKIGKEVFGLGDKEAKYAAIIMDRMVGAMALRSGKSKAEIYKTIEWTSTEDPTKANDHASAMYQKTMTNLATGKSRTMLIDTPEFQEFMKAGRVTVNEKSVHDFEGPVIFHAPDGMFSGSISIGDRELIKGDGGVFYPLEFADENYFWASTRSAASGMVSELNKLAKMSTDGKVRLVLTTGSLTKVFSNTTAARGIVQLFVEKANQSKNPITKKMLSAAIFQSNIEEKVTIDKTTGKKKAIVFKAPIKKSMKFDDMIQVIQDKMDPDNSSFDQRRQFIERLITNMVTSINEQSTENQKKFLNEFFADFSDMESVLHPTVKKKTKLTAGKVMTAVARSLQEGFVNQLFEDGAQAGVAYAVVEVDANPNGDTFRAVDTKGEGRRSHESYPFAIETVNGDKPVVHLLKDAKSYETIANRPGRQSPLGKKSDSLFPPSTGVSKILSIMKPESKAKLQDGKYNDNSGTTQVATTQGSYVKAAKKLMGSQPQSVLDYGAGLGLGTDAMSGVFGFDVDSYEPNPERWKGRRKVTFGSQADINKTYDGIVSLNVLNVVPKAIRDRIVVDIYNKLNQGGKAYVSARKFKGDVANAKNSVPGDEHNSLIITRKSGGQEVEVFQKGFDGDELVEYVQQLLGDKVKVTKDNSFGATGVVIEKLSDEPITDPMVLFQDARAAMTMEDGKAVIYALTNPDVTSPLHEMAHVFEHYLTDEEKQTVMDWAGTSEWNRDASEAFAEGFERFLFQGPTESSKLNGVFEKFREWLLDIYFGIVGSPLDRDLTPEVTRIYESMVMISEPHNVTHASDPNAVWGRRERTWFQNTMDGIKVKYYDKYWRVFMLQKDIESFAGRGVSRAENFMLAEKLMHGRTGERLIRLETAVKKITDFMKETGIDSVDINQYLTALHAEERNEKIYFDQVEAGVEEPNEAGSGMTTKEAREILSDVDSDPELRRELDQIVGMIRDIQKQTQENLVSYGLEPQARIDSWNQLYQNYVPLHGRAADEMNTLNLEDQGSAPNGGTGLHVPGEIVKKAKGRQTRAANAVATVIHQAQAVIVAGEKNKAMQAMYNMVKSNPNKDVWTVTDKADGDHTVAVRINGQKLYIRFDNKSHAQTLKNMGTQSLGLLSKISPMTNWLRKAFTTLDPAFTIVNFLRDIQAATFNALAEKDLAGLDGKYLSTYIAKNSLGRNGTLRALMKHNLGRKVGDADMASYIEEFELEGGKTGWTYADRLETVAKKLKKGLDEDSEMRQLVRMLGGPLRFAEDKVTAINDAFENSVRLATFIAARKKGFDAKDAASLAKEITVNFNRSGENSGVLSSLYLFFNAGIQGTARFGKSMLGLKPKKMANGEERSFYERTNNAQRAAVGLVLTNAMLTMINLAMSDEDDDGELFYNKIPDYVKERNLVIMLDGEKYMKIPMPYGYNIFANFGEAVATVSSGHRDIDDAGLFLFNSFMGSFSPISFGQSKSLFNYGLKAVAPTIIKPFLEAGLNESYFGNSIAREQLPFMTPKSESEMGFYSPKSVQDTFKWINQVFGGTKYTSSGVTDQNPDKFWYIFEYFMGGTGRFITQIGTMITSAAGMVQAGEFAKVEPSDIIFLNKIYGSASRYYDYDRYRKNATEAAQLYNELLDPEVKKNMSKLERYRGVGPLIDLYKETEKLMKVLREARKNAAEIPNYTKRVNTIHDIEERQRKVMMTFNKRYEQIRGE